MFVEKGREKKELPMSKSEAIAAFGQIPPLRMITALLPSTQRRANQRPFLETDGFHFALENYFPLVPFKLPRTIPPADISRGHLWKCRPTIQ